MISCKIKNISYGNHKVLSDIAFKINKGETLLVTGKSGSGKSTLLSFISGILEKDRSVKIDGVCNFSPEISHKSIAYISQNPEANLICNDVKSEILLMGSKNVDDILHVLNTFNIKTEYLDNMVQNLSGGEQQLLAVICAVIRNSQIYILDEPTSMLDYENKMIVVDSLKKLKKAGKTVILASQELDIWSNFDNVLNLGNNKKEYFPIDKFSDHFVCDNIELEVNNLVFGYRRNEILIKGISFTLNNGDVLHISGRNGSGKTTLAKLLAGILKPQKGEIFLNNIPIKKYRYYLPKEFAFSLQNPNWQLLFETVLKEMSFCADKFVSNNSLDYKKYILKLLDNLKIDENTDPRELSFGQRKLISNNSYLNFPKIHLFDEPEIALDNKMKKYFQDYIKLRTDLGLISIIISHETGGLKAYISKCIVLGK